MSTNAATPIQIVIDAHEPLDAGLATREMIHEDDGRLYWNDLVGVGDPAQAGPRPTTHRNGTHPGPRR